MTIYEYFSKNQKVAVGFSGGVDSLFLTYTAKNCGVDIKAYYVRSQFQPQSEINEIYMLSKTLGVDVCIINADILSKKEIIANTSERCYFCKKFLFSLIIEKAEEDGYCKVIEGTNASDDIEDRAGWRALVDLGIESPLRLWGLTKDDIRNELKSAGFAEWNKPSVPCLATRIPQNTRIETGNLILAERAELILSEFGFLDFRVRVLNNCAKIQINNSQFELLFALREQILIKLKMLFDEVLLDLEAR